MSNNSNRMTVMAGRYPGIVKEYLPKQRQCRVEIPGLTDGGDVLPLAEIEYPIGDRSIHDVRATEIRIEAGDSVWLEFIGGDSRYPIITGARNPTTSASTEWRRFQHANIELLADNTLQLITTDKQHSVVINADGVTVNTTGDASVNADGNVSAAAGGNASIKAAGTAKIDGSTVVLNGGKAGGVVCQTHACAFTGLAHPVGSATVTAGT